VVEQAFRQNGLGGTQIRANNLDSMYTTMMNDFEFGGAGKKGVYFDEENRRHILSIRSLFGEAAGNMADAGRKDEAQKLIDKVEAGISPDNLPYGLVSRYNSHNQTTMVYLEGCYKAGKTELAEKVRAAVRKDLEQQFDYYAAIGGMSRAEFDGLFSQYEKMRQEAQMKMAFAQSAEQQNQARMEINRADYFFTDALKDKQIGLRTEMLIARGLFRVMDAVEEKYAPKKDDKPATEGQTTIDNTGKPDSTKKPDSGKQN
jgi:hypothetical protein